MAHPTTYSDEKWKECPECHYAWYRYYGETKDATDVEFPIYPYYEIPVITKTPFGWLCIFCRYEWHDDGTPVNLEDVKEYALKTRHRGKELYAEVQSSASKVK